MHSNAQLDLLMEKYVAGLKRIYGSHLKSVILYGSYARGDFHEGSDIDVMILLDLDDSQIKEYGRHLSDLTFDLNDEYDVMIMPVAKNREFFYRWIGAYPFFNAVHNEGVELYAA